MTEYEIHQLTASYVQTATELFGNYSTHISIYLSLIFGFCVVAYTAGQKLTSYQVILMSLMFLLAAELQAFMLFLWSNSAFDVLTILRTINPDVPPKSSMTLWIQAVGVGLWQLGIVGSLSFMWSVRHPKAE